MKRIVCLIAIVSLVYSNCIYAIGVDTLAGVSPLTSPEYAEAVKNLSRIFDISDGEISKVVYDSRNLFAGLLGDEPDGISVFLNKGLKEIFVFGQNGLIHVYRDSHAPIPAQPSRKYDISDIKIDIYPFTQGLIDFLKGIKDFVLIEGAPSPDYSNKEKREIIERHIESFGDLTGVLPESLRRYLSTLTSAVYAKVPDNISGSLWKYGIPGLIEGEEARNAVRIRDYLINNGRQIDIDGFRNLMVYDGENESDKDLNDIIQRNVDKLLEKLSAEERDLVIQNFMKHLRGEKIAIAIVDRSRHWLENCRGDRFIGINRALLEKIKTLETAGDKNVLDALETYLQTYIYHELRHEAFIEERKLLGEHIYEIDDMGYSDMQDLIERLSEAERKEFEQELERRQNGRDASYFVNVCGNRYEEFLGYLLDERILNKDSLFVHAAVICGFSQDRHYNELTIADFMGIPKDKLARMVYQNYEAEYMNMYRRDKNGTESRYRGKISYLLYKTGLNAHIRVDTWKKESAYDRNLAKEYIIRLIDFTSRYERYLRFVPGRGEVSMFRKRERPLLYRDAAQLLLVSLLTSGDYSQAVLRTELGFKTSGIVNTVTGNKFEFWKMIEEACQEQAAKGDSRFLGITTDTMRSASIEKELLPRLRIVLLFRDYLNALPGREFSRPYMETFHSLNLKYRQYSAGKRVDFNNKDLEDFDNLYKKICELLAKEFNIIIEEKDDLLLALWDTFDLVENLKGDLNYRFSEPLFANGTEGDETRFETQEIAEIKELKKVFDKEDPIKLRDIRAESTKRRVQLIWSIYKTKVLKYREGLCNILNRYGTDKALSGNRVWDLLRQTRGWSSAVWLAREYSKLFSEGVIRESLDMDSGLSVLYYALSKIYKIEPGEISGLKDVISDPASEYFGTNPNRLAGDFTDGGLVDMRTGNTVKLEQESQDLILSVYRLHTVTSPQKMYNIFRNVHRVLKYGGHFAITMPYGRVFSSESLSVLEKELGFEPVVSPGITWNELSSDYREKIIAQFGEDEAKRRERELFKNRFYVIILKKTGVIKEGEEELKDKSLLIPEVLTEREIGKPIMPEVGISGEAETAVYKRIIDEAGLVSAGVLNGINFNSGTVAGDLTQGLEYGSRIKENIGVISEWQDMIRALLEEKVVLEIKLENFINEDLRRRIDMALKYNDSDYTTSVEKELLELIDELERLKNFIVENHKEFMEKIEAIKGIKEYEITDLNENTLQEVRDIYRKLINSLKKTKEETERKRFAAENWERFQELQGWLRRYRIFADSQWMKNNINTVLSVEGRDALSQEIMSKAEDAVKKIAGELSTKKRIFNSLKEFEEAINELFKWIDCEFIFSFTDMKFLSNLKIEWEKDELSKEWLGHIRRLHVFMDVLDEWQILKECIVWGKGLAVLLKDKPENKYMGILDRELLYKPFLTEKGIRGEVLDISPLTAGEEVRDALVSARIGEDLVISVNDLLGITDDFLDALDTLGFEIGNIYEAWLEPDTLEGFMRRGKRIIVVRKIREPASADDGTFNLQMEKEDTRDYSNFMNIREELLQDVDISDFHIHSRELLCRRQIATMYPDWAKIYIGKREWTGILFDREKVEKAVELYRREKEREIERQAKLIKRTETPFIKITYDETWTESLVRDLAQVLLKINIDFDNPDLTDVSSHSLIAEHPQLGVIPRGELVEKIEELIRYRQYELGIERLNRELSRIIQMIFEPRQYIINHSVEIDGISMSIALADVDADSSTLRWHIYTNGTSPSPFGKNPEEWYKEITGNLLALRRIDPKGIFAAPVQKRRLVIHYLSDPEELFKKFREGFNGLEISTARGNLSELLLGIYQDKNFDYRYIKELVELAHLQLIYFLSKAQAGTWSNDDDKKIINLFTAGIERLFSGEMTTDEYDKFTSSLKDRLGTIPEERLRDINRVVSEIEDTEPGRDLFRFYLHGRGQEEEIEVTEDDLILSKYAGEKAKAKYYFDTLFVLKPVRLYILSEDEKKVLNELVNKMLSGDTQYCNKLISYLKADNTVNRYLYWSFIYLSRVWGQEDLDGVTKQHNMVTKEILKTEPEIIAYTFNDQAMNLITLLTELYRLKQMLEDTSLGSARVEIQLFINDFIALIKHKSTDNQLLGELPKMTREILADNIFTRYILALIGNPYHIDFTDEVDIQYRYLTDINRFTLWITLGSDINETVERFIENAVIELGILFTYYPNEIRIALETIAWAVAEAGSSRAVRLFMEKFERHYPSKTAELENLIRQCKSQAPKDDSYWRKILEMSSRVTEPYSEDLVQGIKDSQWLRYMHVASTPLKQVGQGLKSVIDSMLSPYEIYNIIKLLAQDTAGKEPAENKRIIIECMRKMEKFIRDKDWEEGIIDILKRMYNQSSTMRSFVIMWLDLGREFRMFIARLFCSEDDVVSGYAYEYIRDYIEHTSRGKDDNVHEIFLNIITGLLENRDSIESVRFRKMLELFTHSIVYVPEIELKKEWQSIIAKCRDRDTLLAIWRNAKWMIEDTCDRLEDKTKIPEVESRFGLNILTEELKKSDAYFCEMTDSEIDPQIRWLLEKHPERYRFIQGKSTEGKEGELDVPDEYKQAILSACKMVEENDYGIVVLKGVSFSGHYSAKRGGRIYIPYEILEFADNEILIDFIKHEYLHSKGWSEEDIIKSSNIHERARKLYRGHIAEKLANTVKGIKDADILKDKLDRILRRVQEGKKIELSETQLARLLWLIDRSREINIVPQIAKLIDLILEPNYAGDPGQVVMEVEKAILAHLYTEEQLDLSRLHLDNIHIRRTRTGLRFEGKELPSEVKNIINYVYRFNVPESAPVKGTYYVLIDEYRAEKYEEVIKRVSEKWDVGFVTEIPEGVNKNEVVVLIDPEDAGEYRDFQWYLPLIYCEKSFELAAWLSINKPENLIGTPVYEFVKNIYEELLGELNDKDIISWFRDPLGLKNRISNLSENLKLLRIAFMQLDISV